MEVNYHDRIRSRYVVLYTAADVVQHSFIVQNSLTPLNLKMCQCYIVYDPQTEVDYPSFTYSNEVISTEEKCRKVLSKSRSILYTLHLDLPRDREGSFRSPSKDLKLKCDLENPEEAKNSIDDDMEISFVGKISIHDEFYADILYSLVTYAGKRNDDNVKILKWFLKFNPSDKPLANRLPCAVIKHLLKFARNQRYDPNIVIESFRRLDEMKWAITEEPSKHAHLLYYFHQNSKEAKCVIRSGSFVDFIISLSSVQLADVVLKMKNSPFFSDHLFKYYAEKICHSGYVVYRERIYRVMSQQRRTLLLQVFWIYLSKSDNPRVGAKFLRLIWRSIPDSFLTPIEFQLAFHEISSKVYDLYHEAMKKLPSCAMPRKLKHYSRISIRRRLSQNGHWVSDGIKKLDLPRTLKSYLNLKEGKYSL